MSELLDRATVSLDAAKRSYDHGFTSVYPLQLFEEMRDRLAALEQAVTHVRELHGRKPYLIYGTEVREWHCRTCDEPHPCSTIRALDGTEP